MKKDIGVYIGRFQPFHHGHLRTLVSAASQVEEIVVVLGSADQPASLKNPWSEMERIMMIKDSLPKSLQAKVQFRGVRDVPESDQRWAESVRDVVFDVHDWKNSCMYLLDVRKDEPTGTYLDLLRPWFNGMFDEPPVLFPVNARDIRRSYFSNEHESLWEPQVPGPVAEYMKIFRETETYRRVSRELDLLVKQEGEVA